MSKNVKLSKKFIIVKNCQNFKMVVNLKLSKNSELSKCRSCHVSPSNQISQRSQLSGVTLWMQLVKSWLTEFVSEWKDHLLSCSGQLKMFLTMFEKSWNIVFLVTNLHEFKVAVNPLNFPTFCDSNVCFFRICWQKYWHGPQYHIT